MFILRICLHLIGEKKEKKRKLIEMYLLVENSPLYFQYTNVRKKHMIVQEFSEL